MEAGKLLGYVAVSRYATEISEDPEAEREELASALAAAREDAVRRDAVVAELRFFEDPSAKGHQISR